MRNARHWGVLWLSLVAACSADGSGGSRIGGGSSAGGLALSIASAEWHRSIDGAPAGEGHRYLRAQVALRNESAASLSIALPLFGVQTAAGLEVPADARSEGACAGANSLAPSGEAACELVFLLAADAAPALVSYTAPDGSGRSTAALPELAPLPSVCPLIDTLKGASTACVQCLLGAYSCTPPTSECNATEQACLQKLESGAVTSCEAGDACFETDECAAGSQEYVDCLLSTCASSCGG